MIRLTWKQRLENKSAHSLNLRSVNVSIIRGSNLAQSSKQFSRLCLTHLSSSLCVILDTWIHKQRREALRSMITVLQSRLPDIIILSFFYYYFLHIMISSYDYQLMLLTTSCQTDACRDSWRRWIISICDRGDHNSCFNPNRDVFWPDVWARTRRNCFGSSCFSWCLLICSLVSLNLCRGDECKDLNSDRWTCLVDRYPFNDGFMIMEVFILLQFVFIFFCPSKFPQTFCAETQIISRFLMLYFIFLSFCVRTRGLYSSVQDESVRLSHKTRNIMKRLSWRLVVLRGSRCSVGRNNEVVLWQTDTCWRMARLVRGHYPADWWETFDFLQVDQNL